MTTPRTVSRRSVLKIGATAAALPLVHIRTAGAAGKLSVGLWDHWVPAGNEAMRRQVQTWAEKNKVDVQIDFITSVGNKNVLDAGGRGAGEDGTRRADLPHLGGAEPRRAARSGGRPDETSDRQIRRRPTRSASTWQR